jgi:hypothetical protein
MIIVKIQGGLGNQMFQYAFYRAWEEIKGQKARMDLSWYRQPGRPALRGYQIEDIFCIQTEYATPEEVAAALHLHKNRLRRSLEMRFLRKLKIQTGIGDNVCVRDKEYTGNEDRIAALAARKTLYFDGYWQMESYFQPIADTLRAEFSFRQTPDPSNQAILDTIRARGAISVHVRRYSSEDANFKDLSLRYYDKAIRLAATLTADPFFLVFSDDIAWCKKNILIPNGMFVDINHSEADQYKDLQLMSHCPINIIANSTYSWWGAWLNPTGCGKRTIAPKYGLFGAEEKPFSLARKDWIRIDNR